MSQYIVRDQKPRSWANIMVWMLVVTAVALSVFYGVAWGVNRTFGPTITFLPFLHSTSGKQTESKKEPLPPVGLVKSTPPPTPTPGQSPAVQTTGKTSVADDAIARNREALEEAKRKGASASQPSPSASPSATVAVAVSTPDPSPTGTPNVVGISPEARAEMFEQKAARLEKENAELLLQKKKHSEQVARDNSRDDLRNPEGRSKSKISRDTIAFGNEGHEPISDGEEEPSKFDREAHHQWVVSKVPETKKIIASCIAQHGRLVANATICKLMAEGRIILTPDRAHYGLPYLSRNQWVSVAEVTEWREHKGMNAQPRGTQERVAER